jgi:hypothetical protein
MWPLFICLRQERGKAPEDTGRGEFSVGVGVIKHSSMCPGIVQHSGDGELASVWWCCEPILHYLQPSYSPERPPIKVV